MRISDWSSDLCSSDLSIDVDEADDERHHDGEPAGDQHLLEGGARGDVDALGVLGLDALLALAQARDLTELAPDLFDHLVGGPTDGVDRERGRTEERRLGVEGV